MNDREPAMSMEVIDITHGVECFSTTDLATLRADLAHSSLDSFQAAEIVTAFLSGRGYGISTDEARGVAALIDGPACSVEQMQAELARVARAA